MAPESVSSIRATTLKRILETTYAAVEEYLTVAPIAYVTPKKRDLMLQTTAVCSLVSRKPASGPRERT